MDKGSFTSNIPSPSASYHPISLAVASVITNPPDCDGNWPLEATSFFNDGCPNTHSPPL